MYATTATSAPTYSIAFSFGLGTLMRLAARSGVRQLGIVSV